MKCLLRNLTKFIGTVLELYAPLPFEFTADLHTLNAHLRSYSESEEKLLESFVDRLADKLDQKMKYANNQSNTSIQNYGDSLRHYNSCTFKYPQLKLNLQPQPSQVYNLTYNPLPQPQNKPIYSQRNPSHEEGGIKSNRHKFGSKHRNRVKQNNSEINKENLSLTFNINQKQAYPKPLHSNRSQVQLLTSNSTNSILKLHNERSFKEKKQGSKGNRHESNDSNRLNSSSLKIKLRPKFPAIDASKIKQGAQQILQYLNSHDSQMKSLYQCLQFTEEIC